MTREEAITYLNVIWNRYKAEYEIERETLDAYHMAIEALKDDAAQGWDNHEVACILAELFGDACACNYNSIDEWLPLVCDFKDICPNTVGVACWEQFLTHYGERREE